ncbi:MAG: cation transporter, partial [Clostridia bacterium]|nr:cation transporter [Clostridia bacterium]
MEKRYSITGMTCSACSSGIERTVGKLDGVTVCEVSLMAKSMRIEFDENVITEEKIFSTVKSLGYGIFNEGEQPQKKSGNQDKKLFIRFLISVCILIPLLYVSMGHMINAPIPSFIDPHKGNGKWFALYQLILSAGIIGVNYAFFKNGTVAVFKKVPNMDTLVAMGSGVSFIYSTVLTVLIFMGKDGLAMDLHFESAASILTLV